MKAFSTQPRSSAYKLVLFWLLCWVGFAAFSYFWFGWHARVNSIGDGLCDKCGAPATWEHYIENKLVGEYCTTHMFYGTPYLAAVVGFILFIATCGITFLTFVVVEDASNLKSALSRAFFVVSVLAVWFYYQIQYCYTIVQPTLEYTLGLSVFVLVIQLGAVVGGMWKGTISRSLEDRRARSVAATKKTDRSWMLPLAFVIMGLAVLAMGVASFWDTRAPVRESAPTGLGIGLIMTVVSLIIMFYVRSHTRKK
ncbi:hypothetical protein KAU92_02355 [Candidatus Bathyarchaeota archaeon]|nr:hypothetical protein [Candidatus Bathyarchaeota archaeon]